LSAVFIYSRASDILYELNSLHRRHVCNFLNKKNISYSALEAGVATYVRTKFQASGVNKLSVTFCDKIES
jgi:hypothetical protein